MINFFLQRKVLTNLITVFLVTMGVYQFVTIRREAFPEVSFDIVVVTTAYPGASPQEVEMLVTIPIEKELRGINGIDRLESYSLEDRSLIIVRLDEDASQRTLDKSVLNIQQAVNRVEDLPDESRRPIVEEMTSDRPLITVSVAGGTQEDRDRAAEEFRDEIERVEGISKVEYQGDLDREIWVEADINRLRQYQLSLAEIASTLKSQSIELSAGSIETEKQEVWVRVTGRMKTADDVRRVVLRGNDARSFLRVSDVAKVTDRFEEPRIIVKTNGENSINLLVRKQRTGDTIKLADKVKGLVKDWTPAFSEKNISLIVSDDLSFFIKRRLNVMKNNILQGGVLVLACLFLFLDWRLALVAAMGVPISFGTALVLGVPMGLTINLISLLAFIIVLGMLDDDSVVVSENIYRHLEMGKKPAQAAIDGAREVILPVIGSVATSCFAFLPFALMTGIMGKFLIMIPLVVILSFVASALESFFILPAHVLDLLPFGKTVDESHGRCYAIIHRYYEKALRWVLTRRYKFLMLMIAVLAFTAVLARYRVGFVLFPPGLIDQFFVQVETAEGTDLKTTEEVFRKVEAELQRLPKDQMEAVVTTIGMTGYEQNVRRGTHLAQARVFLTPQETRTIRTDSIIEGMRSKLESIPGVRKIVFDKLQPGPPVGKAVQVRITGKEPEKLRELAHSIRNMLSGIRGVKDIRDSTEGGKHRINVIPKIEEAAYAGLGVNRIAQNLLFAVGGVEAAKIRLPEEEVKVRLRLSADQRSKKRSIEDLYVFNDMGKAVPLKPVVRLEEDIGYPYLERYNYRPAVTVFADVQENVTTSRQANSALMEKLKNFEQENPGYQLVYGGEEEETRKSLRSLFRAFIVTMLLDFIILAALFRSYVRPLLILLTVPIGVLGVTYALILHGAPASFMALLGVVAMTGVVINNAIVLMDFIQREVESGKSVMESAVSAGVVRLRPIWASALTTLLGLFPTAYGLGGNEPFIRPMALSMAWGLFFAMPLTLFLIPAAYVLMEDVRLFFGRHYNKIVGTIFKKLNIKHG